MQWKREAVTKLSRIAPWLQSLVSCTTTWLQGTDWWHHNVMGEEKLTLCFYSGYSWSSYIWNLAVLFFTAPQLSGSGLLTSASLDSDCFTSWWRHTHFSLTTGRPVVLDVAVHFHCFVTAGKTATSRWYTCNFDVVSHLFLTTRPIYHSCPGSHFQQLQQHLTTEATTCVQTVINYYKHFTADQTNKKKRKLKRLRQSTRPSHLKWIECR